MLRLTIYNFWNIGRNTPTDLDCLTEVVSKKMRDVRLILPYFRITHDDYGSISIRSTAVMEINKERIKCLC